MLYQIDSEIKQIDLDKINPNKITVGVLSLNELKETYKHLGFSKETVAECALDIKSIRNTVDSYPLYSFGLLNIVNTKDILGAKDKIGFYIAKNLFLIIDVKDDDKSTLSIMYYAVSRFWIGKITIERLIFGMFEKLLGSDAKAIETIELRIAAMEEALSKGRIKKDFSTEIMLIKKKLLILHNYYEQLSDLGLALCENENRLFKDENLRFFRMITDRADRLNRRVQMLREDLAQLREAYQSFLDYNLNNIMKIFTLIATIFLPLTLITSWYGMNFTYMPELDWRYGYLFAAALCLIVAAVLIFIFKKKKLF